MHLRDKYKSSTYKDVDIVIKNCMKIADYYQKRGKIEKAEYIKEHIIPVVTTYKNALMQAGYPSDCFFDSKFTIDTGMICNLGRAIHLFKGLTNYINEPLTPTHERNYGRHCSTMKEENYVWKLACGWKDTINIEKLDLFKTASVEGQTSYRYDIEMNNFNKHISETEGKYLYPGRKE